MASPQGGAGFARSGSVDVSCGGVDRGHLHGAAAGPPGYQGKDSRIGEAVEENQQEGHSDPIVLPDRKEDRRQEIDRQQSFSEERGVRARSILFVPPFLCRALDAVLGGPRELVRSEEHTSELQSLRHLVCRLLLEKKKKITILQIENTQLSSHVQEHVR